MAFETLIVNRDTDVITVIENGGVQGTIGPAGPTGPPGPPGPAGGITEATHEVLDTLVHDIAETSYTKITSSGGNVVNVTIWASVAMLIKIRETTIAYSAGQPSTIVDKQYDAAGVIIVGQTLTHVLSYVSGNVDNITTTET